MGGATQASPPLVHTSRAEHEEGDEAGGGNHAGEEQGQLVGAWVGLTCQE